MTTDQWLAVLILLAALVGFATSRFRYDLVAIAALLLVVATKLIPANTALTGFGHPAVITVGAILIISRALRNAGLVEAIARKMLPFTTKPRAHVGVLTGVVVVFSGFMNNVGALALMLPVAMHTASVRKRPPSKLLMPLAFGSLLGGLVTLIGTPPNVIIAAYHAGLTGDGFGLFDFAPVGICLALIGGLFIVLFSDKLLPADRNGAGDLNTLFSPGTYLVEALIEADSPLKNMRVGAAMEALGGIGIIGTIRGNKTELSPTNRSILQAGDRLMLRADPKELKPVLEKHGLTLRSASNQSIQDLEHLRMMELVVGPSSPLIGRNALMVRRRSGRHIHLLALARAGKTYRTRLRQQRLRPGDVILVYADEPGLSELLQELGLLPLADRALDLHLTPRRKPALAVAIFAAAIIATATGWLPAAVAFVGAVVLYAFTGVLPLRDLYRDLDGPILILLACMIPVGQALETTGVTHLIADQFHALGGSHHPLLLLVLIMIVTMTLSDFVNNAATAVLMAPVAADLALSLGHSPNPYLMAVAVAASCAFLTPIGHQSNTLVMSPAGYRFGDYWKLGLPLEILIIAAGAPLILAFWPI